MYHLRKGSLTERFAALEIRLTERGPEKCEFYDLPSGKMSVGYGKGRLTLIRSFPVARGFAVRSWRSSQPSKVTLMKSASPASVPPTPHARFPLSLQRIVLGFFAFSCAMCGTSAAQDFTNGVWGYNLKTNAGVTNATIVRYYGISNGATNLSVTFPTSVDGFPVRAISGMSTYSGGGFPFGGSSVETARYPVFPVDGVTNAVIPAGVLDIVGGKPRDGFRGTFEGRIRLRSVTIPNTVTNIGPRSFANSGLRTIVLPANLNFVPYAGFSNCVDLTTVTLGTGITEIGDYAFMDSGLTNITLGRSITEIGIDVFKGTALRSVTVDMSNIPTRYVWESTNGSSGGFWGGGSLGEQVPGPGLFEGFASLTNATLGPNVVNIGPRAFRNTGLSRISIPNSVANIEEKAFEGAPVKSLTIDMTTIPGSIPALFPSLLNVKMGNNVRTIASGAFARTALTNIEIPPGVAQIASGAFAGAALRRVVIDMGSVSKRAFEGLANLTNVTLGSSVKVLEAESFRGCSNLSTIVIPTTLTNIGDGVFQGTGLRSIALPTSIKSIGVGAFASCGRLTSASLPAGLTNIGDFAFAQATNLATITIPSSVSRIGAGAFSNCTQLTTAALPNGVVQIGASAFHGTALRSANIPASARGLGAGAFRNAASLSNVVLPATLTIIGEGVFQGTALRSVAIPTNWTSIPASAFRFSAQLTNVVIPESVTSIGANAFEGTGVKSVVFPDSVTSIGDNAFAGTGLTNVVLGSGITNIGANAFGGAGLPTAEVDFAEIPANFFAGFGNLTNVTLGSNVRSIGNNAFAGTGLTSIVIPSGVTNIGSRAFAGLTNLTNVVIPESVTSIGEGAFAGAVNLQAGSVPSRFAHLLANLGFGPGVGADLLSASVAERILSAPGNYGLALKADASNSPSPLNTNNVNRSGGLWSAILSGEENLIETNVKSSAIVGGINNTVLSNANRSSGSVIAGGIDNLVTAADLPMITVGVPHQAAASIGGGLSNIVSERFATVSGGQFNQAVGRYATVPGGQSNVATLHSFAAGTQAKATNVGTFVWADSHDDDFGSTTNNQFLIRAAGGVGINTNDPGSNALSVNGTVQIATIQVLTGSGVPTMEAPNGSLYLNTSGGDTTTLWFRASGSWRRVKAEAEPN